MPKEQPQPFLFEEMKPPPQVEKIASSDQASKKFQGEIEIEQDQSNERIVRIREKVFGRILIYTFNQKTGNIDEDDFDIYEVENNYPKRVAELKAKARALAKKILLSEWAINKRNQEN